MTVSKHRNKETPTAATVEASNQKPLAEEITDMSNSSTVSPIINVNESTLPVIAGHEIAIDEHGRFNLNAIHTASGHGIEKRPSSWSRTSQAKELIKELESKCTDLCIRPIEARKGNGGGTFAHELLAVSYAGWISPKFQLQVNQVFLDYRMGKLGYGQNDHALPAPLTPAHQHGIQKEVAIRVFSNVKDKANHPKAYKAIYRYLKSRFDVGSYKDIPDSKYTQALAAVESAPLEGEWIAAPAEHDEVAELRAEIRMLRKRVDQTTQFADEDLDYLFRLLVNSIYASQDWGRHGVKAALDLLQSPIGGRLHDSIADAGHYAYMLARKYESTLVAARSRLNLPSQDGLPWGMWTFRA